MTTPIFSTKTIANDYKYTIWKHWQNLTKAEQRDASIVLPKLLNISYKTLQRWMYIKKWEDKTISADKLYRIATFFNVSIEQMWTTPPKSLNGELNVIKQTLKT